MFGKAWEWGFLAVLASAVAAAADESVKPKTAAAARTASPRLESFVDADGKGYFALLLRDEGPSPRRPVELALWVDTSASQVGTRMPK